MSAEDALTQLHGASAALSEAVGEAALGVHGRSIHI